MGYKKSLFSENKTNFKPTIKILYDELLKNTKVITPKETKNSKNVYSSYVIRSKRRDRLKNFLEKNNIETNIEYRIPIHLTKTFNNLSYKKGDFPVTEKISKEILSLPISPFLKEKTIVHIAKLINKFENR